jgi:hypothetical protein
MFLLLSCGRREDNDTTSVKLVKPNTDDAQKWTKTQSLGLQEQNRAIT